MAEEQLQQWQRRQLHRDAELKCGETAVRDSKDPGGPVVGVSHRAWVDFVGAVRDGLLG